VFWFYGSLEGSPSMCGVVKIFYITKNDYFTFSHRLVFGRNNMS
jgi:hypothetical protein